jgi:hypothetical protein
MSAAPTPSPEGEELLRSGKVLEKAMIARRLSGSNTIDMARPKVTPSLLTNPAPGASAKSGAALGDKRTAIQRGHSAPYFLLRTVAKIFAHSLPTPAHFSCV